MEQMSIEQERQQVQMLLQHRVVTAVDRATNDSDRSRQATASVLGVSDIGSCHEYARRVIVREEPSQEPHAYDLAAFIGTAVGDQIENALIAAEPDAGWVKQATVVVQMEVDGLLLNIPGHPDLYHRRHLVDVKTRDGLGMIRRSGPTEQEQFQRTLYAAALIDSGHMDPDCWVSNVYVDRSGSEPEPVVWSAPFDRRIVGQARAWLSDVVYAVRNGEEASRDKPREWCWACCPFAPSCRGEDDTDVEGYIEDPLILDAIRVYNEAKAAAALADKDKKSAASVLAGMDGGSTADYRFRWIDIQPTVIPEQQRAGYRRLDLRPIRRKPAPKRKDD